MKVLLINPPYQTLTSNLGVGHQVPLGLLMVGGALLDAEYQVELLDAEAKRLSLPEIIAYVSRFKPDVIMTGHAGSTPAHPVCARMLRGIKATHSCITVYGGVYPTYHAEEILEQETGIDIIVRGEGEATIVDLLSVLQGKAARALKDVLGIVFRTDNCITATADRPPIENLDQYRIGWELIDDWDRYQCFGLGRAAIIQLSRGCPHRCTYCGQHGFWVNWRHRDPVRVVDEIQWLHDKHQVRFITLADENPTTLPEIWRQFLEELARRKLDVHFFATIRATDIVRDRAMLGLYRTAGLLYILMGVDTVNATVQQEIRKNSTLATDREACRLLRKHDIFAMLGYIVGFSENTWKDYWQVLRQLVRYDADLLNAMFATPHSWTPFARQYRDRLVVQKDLGKWDYRHQVLAHQKLSPSTIFLAVKWLELCFHLRPRKWLDWLLSDTFKRSQIAWCFLHTGKVWLGEIVEFLIRVRIEKLPRPLAAYQPFQRMRARPVSPASPDRQSTVGARLVAPPLDLVR
jgi:anaerobic magnesium-protoporphyrin IX monomethyl ester cyclase